MLALNFKPFPVLETDRLILRKITKHDIKDLLFLRSNADVMLYLDTAKANGTREIKDLITKIDTGLKMNTAIGWGISLKDTEELIGTISYHRIEKDHHRAEIGYILKPAYWQKGITSEALTSIIAYGFYKMNLHSIEATVNPANKGSIRLLEKSGFIKEAYFKENHCYNGVFLDSAVYSLLKSQSSNNL